MAGKKTFLNKTNPLDKLSGAGIPKSSDSSGKSAKESSPTIPKQSESKTNHEELTEKTPPAGQKRKPVRPKTKDIKNTCKTISVAVPITLLNKWEEIKIVHGSNLTEYITKLIEKDMNANYEHYKNITDSLKNI